MSYDPSNPRVYFDIGEAIAAIAILLAFTALANPTRKFRWKLGWFRLPAAYILFFAAITFVIVAALVPLLPRPAICVFGYALFWEVLAGVFFALGSVGLIVSGELPVRFGRRNYKQFFKECSHIIAQGENAELGALADEVGHSAEPVVGLCKGYDRMRARFAREKGEQYKTSEVAEWTAELLKLWSDKKFCNTIVVHCPSTAIRYFREIQKQHLYGSGGYFFVQQLIREAFRDEDSILHREEPHYGLGHFMPFTQAVFGDYAFVNSEFRPLQAAGHSFRKLKVLEKFGACLKIALESYLAAGRWYEHPSALWCGVDVLVNSAREFTPIFESEDMWVPVEDRPSWALWRIVGIFRDMLELIQKAEATIPDYAFDATHYDHFRDDSIYGVMARGIYEFLDPLSRVKGHDEDVRQTAIQLWMEVYPVAKDEESKTLVEIQKRLEHQLWEQVTKNLEDARMCYPMITRLLVSLEGLHEEKETGGGRRRVRDELHRLLRAKFRKAAQLTEARAVELLPDWARYDKERGEIVERDRWGEIRTVFRVE